MADVLSQSEVDALLAAVGTEEDGGDAAGADAAAARDVQFYDFLRPERVASTEQQNLLELHEAAARTVAAMLSASLGQSVQFRLQSIDQLSWGELVMGLPNPTCFAIANVATGDADADQAAGDVAPRGALAFELPYEVVFPMIDRLLGSGAATADQPPPDRALTEIESRVAATVVEIALGAFEKAYRPLAGTRLVLSHLEANPQLVSLCSPTEMAIMVTFDVGIGRDFAAKAHLCVPLHQLGPVVHGLATAHANAAAAGTPSQGEFERALMKVPVAVEVYAEGPVMCLRDIVRLAAGQTVDIGSRSFDDVRIAVSHHPVLRGSVGEFHGNRAVKVLGSPVR